MALSEDTKVSTAESALESDQPANKVRPIASPRRQERLVKAVDVTKTVLHYGW